MNNLMDVLKDQAAFGFTGKINLLLASNGQFHGVVYQHEGSIIGASCGNSIGKKALYKMIFEDVDSFIQFKFVVEPEVIAHEHFSMKMSFDEIKIDVQTVYQNSMKSKKLKPNMELRLVIDPEVIVNNEFITSDEFDILSVLAEWCKVSDVYKYSQLMEFEVTNALVSLRKKRAIKVFQN
jgi:hypothetical protein